MTEKPKRIHWKTLDDLPDIKNSPTVELDETLDIITRLKNFKDKDRGKGKDKGKVWKS
jgi:hypothetical protein